MNDYAYQYGVPDSVLQKIYPLLLEKAKEHAALDLQMPYSRARDSLHNKINTFSDIKIKRTLIRFGCFSLSDSRLAGVMRYKKMLALTEPQLDTIALKIQSKELGDYYYKLSYKAPRREQPSEDNPFLQKILTAGQFDSLLNIEAVAPASANASRDWWNLARLKLTDGVDSAAALVAIRNYHLACALLESRYYNDHKKYSLLLNNLQQNKPGILNQLEAALKKEYETSPVREEK